LIVVDGPAMGPKPLSFLLVRLAAELRILRAEGQTVEEAIGDSLLGEKANPRDTLANLQKIDVVVQSLGEISSYLDALVAALPVDPDLEMDEALQRITLRDLARSLSGGWRKQIIDASGDAIGEVELF
jgi:hypothetical protein